MTHGIPPEARVISRMSKAVSAWIQLETVSALMPGGSRPETFHALSQADYVQVLCFHATEGLVLVEQFRPVLDRFTLEFPGGLREGAEPPMDSARREVVEETGLSVREIVPLIETFADVGRLTNTLFGYFALVEGSLRTAETGIVPKFLPASDIPAKVAEGAILPASNIALLYLAGLHSRVRTICAKLGFNAPPWMPGPCGHGF
jgi:8-oxo-dGTP pyrophosphatase MutT (NUDIX family)